jgi:hypothetical protein
MPPRMSTRAQPRAERDIRDTVPLRPMSPHSLCYAVNRWIRRWPVRSPVHNATTLRCTTLGPALHHAIQTLLNHHLSQAPDPPSIADAWRSFSQPTRANRTAAPLDLRARYPLLVAVRKRARLE